MYMCSINLLGYEVRNSQNCLGHLMRTAQIDGVVGRRVNSTDYLFPWRCLIVVGGLIQDFMCWYIYGVVS